MNEFFHLYALEQCTGNDCVWLLLHIVVA